MARTGVQVVIVAAGAFVLGVVVGGVGPRGEVRELEAQVFELERVRARGDGTAAGERLARLITRGLDAPDDAAVTAAPALPTGSDTDVAPPPVSSTNEGDRASEIDPLVAARETLDLRRTQARAALVEDVDPTGEQLDHLDRITADMNADLEAIARRFVETVQVGEEPSRREMMATGADVLDVLATSEARMLEVLTPEQLDGVREEATDPTSYIDPRVIDVLSKLAPEAAR